jgi:hypothetical protein
MVHTYYWNETLDGDSSVWDCYNNTWYSIARKKASRVMADYFRVQKRVAEPLDADWQRSLGANPVNVLGVHLRGTDKAGRQGSSGNGRQIVPVSDYIPYVSQFTQAHTNAKIFVATDDKRLLESFNAALAEAGVSVPVMNQDKLMNKFVKRGDTKENVNLATASVDDEAGVFNDIYFLSKCQFLLHTASAVSETAIYMNRQLHTNSVHLQYSNRRTPRWFRRASPPSDRERECRRIMRAD